MYSGYHPSLPIPSDHDRDMQTRLSLDPPFANWFYVDFPTKDQTTGGHQCPFRNSDKKYLHPVTPMYFICAENDHK